MEIISNGALIAITLNDWGVKIFGYEGEENDRVVFFVDQKSKNYSTIGGELISGHFIFQFEKSPKETLNKGNRNPSRITYPIDSRIISYDYPTPEEFDDFFTRMNQISQANPIYSERINKIVSLVSLQRQKCSCCRKR